MQDPRIVEWKESNVSLYEILTANTKTKIMPGQKGTAQYYMDEILFQLSYRRRLKSARKAKS